MKLSFATEATEETKDICSLAAKRYRLLEGLEAEEFKDTIPLVYYETKLHFLTTIRKHECFIYLGWEGNDPVHNAICAMHINKLIELLQVKINILKNPYSADSIIQSLRETINVYLLDKPYDTLENWIGLLAKKSEDHVYH